MDKASTIYLLTFIRNRDRATLQQLVMNYRPNGTEMDTVIRTIQKNYLGIRNACLYDYSKNVFGYFDIRFDFS
ncbi:hypothetical protein LAPL110952_13380 [Lactiplantibacillus plajomi]